jgi:homoserine O-acetyltransferase
MPDLIVEKRVFELPNFATMGDAVIRQVRVGWESYGELNVAKDNAILVTHFFSANSHAAGKYRPDDVLPGYWDAIIETLNREIDRAEISFVIQSFMCIDLSLR